MLLRERLIVQQRAGILAHLLQRLEDGAPELAVFPEVAHELLPQLVLDVSPDEVPDRESDIVGAETRPERVVELLEPWILARVPQVPSLVERLDGVVPT